MISNQAAKPSEFQRAGRYLLGALAAAVLLLAGCSGTATQSTGGKREEIAQNKADTQQKKGKAKEPEKVDPETAARRKSTDNLAILAQAIQGIAGGGPPLLAAITDKNGKPLLSWRVAMLPAIDYP